MLVHGSWQGAWCWRRILPLLTSQGHRPIALDLPGHGQDNTPLDQLTLEAYVEAVAGLLNGLDDAPILVGHSMAGGVISCVAESSRHTISGMVHVAAVIPSNGSSMLSLVEGYDPQFLETFVWAADGRSARITPDGARRFLYPLCPSVDVEEAIERLTPEPVAPFEAPITTTQERCGCIPSYYVETSRDRCVPPGLQKSIQARMDFRGVFSLNTDHSPFFSAPNELVTYLSAIARQL